MQARCKKCGYVLGAFETTCRRCAWQPVWPPPPTQQGLSPAEPSRVDALPQCLGWVSFWAMVVGLLVTVALITGPPNLFGPFWNGQLNASGEMFTIAPAVLFVAGIGFGLYGRQSSVGVISLLCSSVLLVFYYPFLDSFMSWLGRMSP